MTTPTPPPLDHAFYARIEKDGAFPTYLTVPDSAEVLGTRRPVKVEGTIDDQPFAATLMPSGQGPHWLPLKADLCRRLGKADAHDEVAVHLTRRLS